MQDTFKLKSNYYKTRNAPVFSLRNVKKNRYELQTISYNVPKIWNLEPKEMKQVTPLYEL